MNTYSSMPLDARKAIDSTAAALCLVHDSDTALDAVNKTDDCIRSFPHCAQALTSLTMSSVETFLTENVTTHIRQFGTDNQYKAAAELHDKPEPIFLSPEYQDNEDRIAPVQDALVKLLSD